MMQTEAYDGSIMLTEPANYKVITSPCYQTTSSKVAWNEVKMILVQNLL